MISKNNARKRRYSAKVFICWCGSDLQVDQVSWQSELIRIIRLRQSKWPFKTIVRWGGRTQINGIIAGKLRRTRFTASQPQSLFWWRTQDPVLPKSYLASTITGTGWVGAVRRVHGKLQTCARWSITIELTCSCWYWVCSILGDYLSTDAESWQQRNCSIGSRPDSN